MFDLNWMTAAGYALLLVGLIGTVVPILPGPVLIWLGTFLWAAGDNFVRIGWPTLTVLAILALVAWGADLFLTTVTSRRAGASWKSIGGAILGGLLGGILLSGLIPIAGTLFGAMAGAFAGMWLTEYYDKRDRAAALTSVRAYIGSMIVAAVLEFCLAMAMIGIFAWQAFL